MQPSESDSLQGEDRPYQFWKAPHLVQQPPNHHFHAACPQNLLTGGSKACHLMVMQKGCLSNCGKALSSPS